MQSHKSVSCLLLLLSAGMASGQETVTNTEPMPRVESLRQSTMLQQDGAVLRAGGFDYEATFTPGGMRYVPALGERAPTTQHLALRPIAVGRGGQVVLDLAAVRTAPRIAAERSVHFPHRDTVRERYDVTPRGLQLSWQFDAPLAGGGDLFVRYHLDTSLQAAAAVEGLSFHLPGVGGVGIGAVTGIDAGGSRVPGSLHLDGSLLELRLPAAFVDSASYPLVLDPLVGTQFLAETGGWNDMQPDVAYDSSNDVYLVVFRRVFSATSSGIRAQRISGSGALVGGFLTLTGGAFNVVRPTVANLNLRDTFVVVWQEAPSIWESHDLMARSVHAATGALSTTVAIASGVADQFNPDACGDNTLSDDDVLVVYQESTAGVGAGIKVAVVNVPSTGATPVLEATRVVTSVASAANPAISNSQISTRARLVVWTETSATASVLRARAMDRDGNLLGSQVTVASGTLPAGPGKAAVDGDGEGFLVAYEVGEAGSTFGERDIRGRPLSWNGNATALTASPAVAIDTRAGYDQKEPAVAFCLYKYVVTYSDQTSVATGTYDVRGVELAANCTSCGSPFVLTGLTATTTRTYEFQPAIASKFAGGATTNIDALIVFTEADESPPFEGSVIAQRYSALGSGGAVTYLGSGCGVAGPDITVVGPFAVGNTGFQVRCTGVPAGALTFLLFSLPGSTVSCGPCVYTNAVASEFVHAPGGTASFFYRMPCSTYPFVGASVQVQWALLYTVSPCPLIAGLSFTRRARLTLGL